MLPSRLTAMCKLYVHVSNRDAILAFTRAAHIAGNVGNGTVIILANGNRIAAANGNREADFRSSTPIIVTLIFVGAVSLSIGRAAAVRFKLLLALAVTLCCLTLIQGVVDPVLDEVVPELRLRHIQGVHRDP